MRPLLLMLATVSLAGCATVDPARVELDVEPITQICGTSDRAVPVRMHVRNDSQGTLKVWIDPGARQPPYALSWLSYQLLIDSGITDWRHGPGAHGPMPPSTLSIGPGEATEVVGSLYSVSPADYGKSFMIQFSDVGGAYICVESVQSMRSTVRSASDPKRTFFVRSHG